LPPKRGASDPLLASKESPPSLVREEYMTAHLNFYLKIQIKIKKGASAEENISEGFSLTYVREEC
jgi:hypothetical protein